MPAGEIYLSSVVKKWESMGVQVKLMAMYVYCLQPENRIRCGPPVFGIGTVLLHGQWS